ncbi:hypothetical protein AJ79_09507 [Helicocarpus griseus UAMH5409]|uniref:SHSP domain-containing protein n=1 Tax=Helicocarpus griseus UAMH5409 TaxID=1447875 RepID=A0A2B7WJ29_9EURO|nr:hypothetical protein AJ79_09507 [Helicocarpus griseus UAMH5409]
MFPRRAITPSLKGSFPSTSQQAYRISKLSTVPPIHLTTTIFSLNHCNPIPSDNHQVRTMSFFPRVPAGDFTPLFRLLDDYETHRAGSDSSGAISRTGGLRTFAPRFDVREGKDAYHLDGELPGINQKDIDIEFTDSQTLVIKGRSEREYSASSGGEPGEKAGKKTHHATVEDEGEGGACGAVTKTGGTSQEVGQVREGTKFWVSERSVGEFSRTFSFPTKVDQNGVKASLKNGILTVTIPKTTAPSTKKITIDYPLTAPERSLIWHQ